MSYSESYSTSVEYSGSVSYSFPASENGGSGTVNYSGSVPVNVTIHVNTTPFDGSVNTFNKNVDILTGSVVAMNTAQCAAINETAKKVSQSLINGFFGTIKTEISQQLQALKSAMNATLGLIMQQSKAVSETKNVMEKDYNSISSRYIDTFTELDEQCHKSIYALDKQSFRLSEKVQKELLSEIPSNAAALNLLGIEETSSSKMFVLISSLNRKTLDVLKTMHDYITQELRINTAINSFLFNETIAGKTQVYTPVIFTESDMLESMSVMRESFIPVNFEGQEKQTINEKVEIYCSSLSQNSWEALPDIEREALNKEFNAMAEADFTDLNDETEQRVYKTMLSLWQDSKLYSLKRSV